MSSRRIRTGRLAHMLDMGRSGRMAESGGFGRVGNAPSHPLRWTDRHARSPILRSEANRVIDPCASNPALGAAEGAVRLELAELVRVEAPAPALSLGLVLDDRAAVDAADEPVEHA